MEVAPGPPGAVQGAQQTVNRRVDGVKGQATETWDNLEKIFQTRVQRALHQLGMPTAEEIGALTRKVNELTDSVDKLARVQGPGRAAAPATAAGKKKPATKGKAKAKGKGKSAKSSRGRQSRS